MPNLRRKLRQKASSAKESLPGTVEKAKSVVKQGRSDRFDEVGLPELRGGDF